MNGSGDSRPSTVALRFFLAATLAVVVAAGLATAGIYWQGAGSSFRGDGLPPIFLLSTVLLFAGSVLLHGAVEHVRRERQKPFRRRLIGAAVVAVLFLSSQAAGLWNLLGRQDVAETTTGSAAFLFAIITLHALHFSVAVLFLLFVTVRALADYYDHEYYWGVVVCAWFWHALLLVWLGILGVLAITSI